MHVTRNDDGSTRVPPIVISFMLACYYSPKPDKEIGHLSWNSESGIDTRAWLSDNGLIDVDYRATDKGKAWIEYICSTPLPIPEWVLPERPKYLSSNRWRDYGKTQNAS